MADDETTAKKSFEELFKIYSNYSMDPLDVDNVVYEAILLSQIDFWLAKAQLFKTVFSIADTGMAWMKFKKWRLDFYEFEMLLKTICEKKNLDFEDIKNQLTEAGPPSVTETDPVLVK